MVDIVFSFLGLKQYVKNAFPMFLENRLWIVFTNRRLCTKLWILWLTVAIKSRKRNKSLWRHRRGNRWFSLKRLIKIDLLQYGSEGLTTNVFNGIYRYQTCRYVVITTVVYCVLCNSVLCWFTIWTFYFFMFTEKTLTFTTLHVWFLFSPIWPLKNDSCITTTSPFSRLTTSVISGSRS